MVGSALAQTTITGPSSSQSPYLQPSVAGYSITSILTTGDAVGNYTMVGLPDGLGAFDNNDGTFTLLMNHEFGSGSTGAVHAYGTAGAFVSKWIINKTTLAVVSGADLTQNMHLWNASSSTYSVYNSTNTSTLAGFSRFCSADLAPISAYYNSSTGKGTQARIFLDGEESGSEGRMMAHIASGMEAGHSYELPYLGKFSAENQVACPFRSDKTIVAGFDDATPGQVYIYIGNKSATGNDITKAGLSGGTLYGIAVSGMITEVNGSVPAANTNFSLMSLGQVQATTGASLNTMSNNLGITTFLRPEDGAWDPSHPSDLYFCTTNSFSSPSRLWKLHFTDINNPQLGGTITAVLDGTEGQVMFDNLGIDHSGHIILQEDVGNNAHNGKMWEYTIATGALVQIALHDATRFISGGANFLTQDEEASGVIDVQEILGPGKFIFVDQAHYSQPSPLVEGGQLLILTSAKTATSNPEINVQGNSVSIPMGTSAISSGNNTDFGLLNTGLSVTKTFVIQNTGTGPLVISGMDFTGTNAGDFTFVTPPSFPVTVIGGGSQNITVKFNPALAGTRTATVNIYNNDYNENIYDFAVQGVGAVPEINVQGNNVSILDGNASISSTNNTDFGIVIYNTAVVKEFKIQNTGTGTLTVTGMNINGATSAAYTFVNAPTFPFTLAGNASQTFSVQYLSTVPDVTNTAVISINNNDTDESIYDFHVEGKSLQGVGIKTNSKTESFVSLFPNPANNEAKVKVSLENNASLSLTVIDIQGKVVLSTLEKEYTKGENEISLNTTSLINGEYFVKIISGNKANTIKLVIIH